MTPMDGRGKHLNISHANNENVKDFIIKYINNFLCQSSHNGHLTTE